jgi:type I restriction enzyme S subunit
MEPPRYINDPGEAYHVDTNDLFMVRYGNPGLLGHGFKGVIANNLFRLIPKIKLENKYFYYLLSFKNDDILQLVSSTTMAALNFTSLNALSLFYPVSLDEQKNTILILSDMDNEIALLEKKLTKTKLIRQGMMQNLLTGKIRLV